MTLADALDRAKWERIANPTMPPGSFVLWSVEYGQFRRTWPSGDACEFRASPDELERRDWALLDQGWK